MTTPQIDRSICVINDRIATLDCYEIDGASSLRETAPLLAKISACLGALTGAESVDGILLRFCGPPGDDRANDLLAKRRPAPVWICKSTDSTDRFGDHLRTVITALTAHPLLTIAMIDGPCVAAAAELAAWCDYRVATDRLETSLEYPFTRWGVVPELGATVRLPRLIGVPAASHLIACGQPVSAQTARRIKLVDRIVPESNQLLAEAVDLIRDAECQHNLPKRRAALRCPVDHSEAMLQTIEDHLHPLLVICDHPAPDAAHAAIDLVNQTLSLDASGALEHVIARSVPAPTKTDAAALWHVDRLVRESRAVLDRLSDHDQGKPTRGIGVCGAGVMGRGIAAAALAHGIPVRLHDASAEALARAVTELQTEFAADRQTPWTDLLCVPEAERRLRICTQESDLGDCDLIIESIVETRELKQQVLRRLELASGPTGLLVSNTSTLPVTDLAASLKRPDQFCGLHFCNPVRRRQLVEIVRGQHTSRQTLASIVDHALRMGKLPLIVRDSPGFLINRLLLAYLNEALAMLCEGIPLPAIDQAARAFGMPLGPFELLDMIGTDTAMLAGRTLWEAFPDRVALTPVLPALVKRNRLGWATKVGFYRYANVPGPGVEDGQFTKILRPYIRPRKPAESTNLMHRLLLPMVLEATRVLDDEVVSSPQEIDVGVVFGLAFPVRRGGLCYWADQVGIKRIVELLRGYERLGKHMEPTDRLRQMAAHGTGFYSAP